MTAEPDYTKVHTFNGLIETSMRLLILLERFHGQRLDFEELRLLDFFVVFATDIGGPNCLHVPVSGRVGAYNIRGEHYFPAALTFLERGGLIEREGTAYTATHAADPAPFFSPYVIGLDGAAAWLKGNFDENGRAALFKLLRTRVFELKEADLATGFVRDDSRFTLLHRQYEADIDRLAGLVESCSVFAAYLENDRKIAANDDGALLPTFEFFEELVEQARTEARKTDSLLKGLKELVADMDRVEA